MDMIDVVAFGELLIDFTCVNTDMDGYPTMTAHPGGAPANFLAALTQYGVKTAMLGKVGTDAFGKLLTGTLQQAGIETRGLVAADDVFTTLAFVTLDEHIRPRFGVWENVPGAFSSGTPKGEDFRIVLEEFLRISFDSVHVPGPYTGRWESAGRILLGDTFSLAWRVFDTQYWPGTPQRRRRIYLVVDFGGETAPKILFDQESLCRDYSAGIRTGEAPAGATADRP